MCSNDVKTQITVLSPTVDDMHRFSTRQPIVYDEKVLVFHGEGFKLPTQLLSGDIIES